MYRPDKKILERYADVIVNFALGGGRGIKKGDVVYITAYEYAKPLYAELMSAITKAGGHAISSYRPNDDRMFSMSRDFYVNARDRQINFFPGKYFRGLIDEIDHSIFIASDTDMEALKGVDPKKIMARGQALKPFHDWRNEKESQGGFTWTIALYGTEAMAKEAGLSEKEYWAEIIKACFLDSPRPIGRWRGVQKQVVALKKRLTGLKIEKLHVSGPDADLWLTLGEKRIWDGGDGRNIPGFEVFTSPDWRGAHGWIKFNQPIYTHGHLIKGVELKFKKGIVAMAKAAKNQKLLEAIIRAPNGDKVGEFSLTDKRFSKITKFMAETLYDENVGGPNGNTHIALGDSFHGCYAGNPAKLKKGDWAKLGFNNSAVHQDIVSTAPRTVTAYLKNRKESVIYKNGIFVI
jgi:aminopeptidase